MVILVFIAVALGIACLLLDRFPDANWGGTTDTTPPAETPSANTSTAPSESEKPSTEMTTAVTTEPTTEPTTEATTEPTTVPTTEATTVPETTVTVTGDIGYQAAMLAADQIGKPYRFGGEGPDDFDASGLLMYCYGQLGITVPRSTAGQSTFGYEVPREELKPGDAIFLWSTTPGQPESVAIYIGNSIAVASFNSKRPVYEFNIESNYYREHFVYGRRFY